MNISNAETSELSPNQTITTIKEVMAAEEGIIFVHGIHATFSPKENSLLNEIVSWKEKLDIALNLGPILSVSSIKSGEQASVLFSKMGLVLADGKIEAVYSGDGGTKAKNLQSRELFPDRKQSSLSQAVNRTGDKFGWSECRYNEFVIRDPQFAGFFYSTDMNKDDRSRAPLSEVMAELEIRGIPLFLLENGSLFTTINGVKGEQCKNIQPLILDPKKKESETERILASSFININTLSNNNRELSGVVAFGWGEKEYLDFFENRYNNGFRSYEEKIPKDNKELTKKARHLITFAIGNQVNNYFLFQTQDGKDRLVREERDYGRNSHTIDCSYHKDRSYANIGRGLVKLRGDPSNPKSRAAALIDSMNEYPDIDKIVFNSQCYLAGFAAAAEYFGDNETAEFIQNYLGLEQYSLVKKAYEKRIGADGRLILLKSDLYQINQ
ncbi:hypothetical protein KA062_02215 [Patescibacteria group bacterium]|nr:hypothetical protein [Patescibacteria group bacterium]